MSTTLAHSDFSSSPAATQPSRSMTQPPYVKRARSGPWADLVFAWLAKGAAFINLDVCTVLEAGGKQNQVSQSAPAPQVTLAPSASTTERKENGPAVTSSASLCRGWLSLLVSVLGIVIAMAV